VLLAVIVFLLIGEWRSPRTDWSPHHIPAWKWLIALPMMAWAFFYPAWRFDGSGFDWNPTQLLSGNYGLMGCPVTLMVLSLLFLRYPRVNPHLYRVLILYAVMLGGAMVLIGYRTDIPFFFMGLFCLAHMAVLGFKRRTDKADSSNGAQQV
jgi:hypothetical protein